MRVVMWDLETTNLSALMGRILCCSFKPLDGDVYTFRGDEKPWKGRSKVDDSRLAVAIREELEKYDLVVGHNSRLFDHPMLDARLAKAGHRPFRKHFICDTRWYLNSGAMRIGSAKLVNAQKFFGLAEEKTEISWEQWQLASMGDKAAMDEVVHHCEQDVRVLEDVYKRVLPFVATIHR